MTYIHTGQLTTQESSVTQRPDAPPRNTPFRVTFTATGHLCHPETISCGAHAPVSPTPRQSMGPCSRVTDTQAEHGLAQLAAVCSEQPPKNHQATTTTTTPLRQHEKRLPHLHLGQVLAVFPLEVTAGVVIVATASEADGDLTPTTTRHLQDWREQHTCPTSNSNIFGHVTQAPKQPEHTSAGCPKHGQLQLQTSKRN